MIFNCPLVVESCINSHLFHWCDVLSFVIKKREWAWGTQWCKKRELNVIIHYLNIFSDVFRWHIISVLWCMKEVFSSPLQAATNSTMDLKLWEWVQFFFINNHVIRKKLLITKWFVVVAEITWNRAASCNSFQTSVRCLLRLSYANLFAMAVLWCCIRKCLLALRVGWSQKVPALLTNDVSTKTGGAKVEHILQYHLFSQLLK